MECDFARAPDAAPTGKTWEVVKERLSFYSFHFYSQSKAYWFIPRVFNEMQLVHSDVTSFCAMAMQVCTEEPFAGRFSPFSGHIVGHKHAESLGLIPVKISRNSPGEGSL